MWLTSLRAILPVVFARTAAVVGLTIGVGLLSGACSAGTPQASAITQPSAAPGITAAPTTEGPLLAPATSPTQDAAYLADLAEADPTLATYMQTEGNVGFKALLTDGSAFCAFLQQGGGIDNAMASLVDGANSLESQTHLPSSVTTFNAIDAVALLTLCPKEQKLIPPTDQSKIRALGSQLSQQSG